MTPSVHWFVYFVNGMLVSVVSSPSRPGVSGSDRPMPRKKSTEGKPVNVVGTELKAVRLELTPEIHKELRIEAARRDMSMAALVRGLVEDFLSRRSEAQEKPAPVRAKKKGPKGR